MTNTPEPYPRTVAVLSWLFGNLSDLGDRQYRHLELVFAGAGVVIGLLVVFLLPVWVSLAVVALCSAGLVWLLRVAAAYGWRRG